MESSEGRPALSENGARTSRIKKRDRCKAIPFLFKAQIALLLRRDGDHAGKTVRAVLRVCLRDSVEPDHRNLCRRDARKSTDRSKLLIVEINGGVRIGGRAIEAGLATVGQKVGSELMNHVEGVRRVGCSDLVLSYHL